MLLIVQVELRFNAMGEISITELAHRTGLATSALRFYERKGLLRSVGRAGGMRVFAEESVEQVALVDLLKLSGFTLSEIATLVGPDGKVALDWRERTRDKLVELEARAKDISRARTMLEHTVGCPHRVLDECPVHRRIVRAHAAALGSDG